MHVLLLFILLLILLVVLIRRPSTSNQPTRESLSQELERLESLKLRGILSQEEFEQCKNRALYSINDSSISRKQ
ncbi:MAG: SHOCT domain-containing protein [Balneolaceae bacterium]|nr:SHOCT domain-containing protein [Balneolaceae bacterium]